MEWICFYLIPLIVAWKKREENLGCEVFSLYKTMLCAFVCFWCAGLVRQSIAGLLPGNTPLHPWLNSISVILIWLLLAVILEKVTEKLIPKGLDNFIFPGAVSRFLTPLTVFFNTALILAMVFTIFVISPAAKYVPFVSANESLLSSARFRILCNTFFVDRFSWQPYSINQRRRDFDRFIPEVSRKASGPKQKNTGTK